MPELRVLTERLVKTTVERATASLLDRQCKLEAKLEHSKQPSFEKPQDIEAQLAAAIAPLLAKQREFERLLETLREAEVRPASSLGAGADHVPGLPTSAALAPVEEQIAARRARPPPLPSQAVAELPSAIELPAIDPHPGALARAALSANASVDIPAELNGSRRKRLVVFLLVAVLVGILATVAALSVMSNMGAYP